MEDGTITAPAWETYAAAILVTGLLWWRVGRWAFARYLWGNLVFRNWAEILLALFCGPFGWKFLRAYSRRPDEVEE